MSDIYDDPELAPQTGFPDNITFDTIGDQIKARITRFDRIDTQYGKVAKYWLTNPTTGESGTMLAGAQDLWSQLHKLRPGIGDILDIELIGMEGRRKIFRVEVTPDPGEEPF